MSNEHEIKYIDLPYTVLTNDSGKDPRIKVGNSFKSLFVEEGGVKKVLNPATGKYVLLTAKTGKDILNNKIFDSLYKTGKMPARATSHTAPVSTPAPVPATALIPIVSRISKPSPVKVMDPVRSAKLDDTKLTSANIATLSPTETISAIVFGGDSNDFIQDIIRYAQFKPNFDKYQKEFLSFKKQAAAHSVSKVSDDDLPESSSTSFLDKGRRDSKNEHSKMLDEYEMIYKRLIDGEETEKDLSRLKIIMTDSKINDYEDQIKEIRNKLRAFGTSSSKFNRAKRSNKKGIFNLKVLRNMGKVGKTKKRSNKKTKKQSKTKTKTKFGHIYGLQDSPPGYTGVFPLSRGPPGRVPWNYLGNPMNTVPQYPNLDNVVRDYTNTGPGHGRYLNNFGLPVQIQQLQKPRMVIPRPLNKVGY